jgi:hypothetical protein
MDMILGAIITVCIWLSDKSGNTSFLILAIAGVNAKKHICTRAVLKIVIINVLFCFDIANISDPPKKINSQIFGCSFVHAARGVNAEAKTCLKSFVQFVQS